MNVFDYVYFSLLKRSINKWQVKGLHDGDAKASFINGFLYVLIFYHVLELCDVDLLELSLPGFIGIISVAAILAFLPLIVYSFGNRAGLIGRFRHQVSNGGWIMVIFHLLWITALFFWNWDFVREMLTGE
jgi:hypothetical protein